MMSWDMACNRTCHILETQGICEGECKDSMDMGEENIYLVLIDKFTILMFQITRHFSFSRYVCYALCLDT